MAGLMDQLVGHQPIRNWLISQYQKGQLPSSMIFQGPQGVGKKFLPLGLLQWINCPYKTEGACGQCSDCRRVLEEQNEIIYHLTPEGKKNIGVDQVRDIHRFLTLRSIKPARFVVIDPADSLSTSAANSLLKVLEESPEQTYFILVTEKMRSLLPTIRSRSHILKFQSLSRDELTEYQNFSPLALNWSGGKLQMALELQDQKTVDQLNASLKLFYQLLCEGPQDWKKQASWFFNDPVAREYSLIFWAQALAKRLHQEGDNLDWVPEESGKIAGVYESLQSLQQDLEANVDKLLALENFYYRIQALELSP